MRDAVFVTTRNGEIVEANDSALTLFRCGRDEVVGLDVRKRLVFRPEDVRRFQEDTVRKGRATDVRVQIRHPGGFIVPATISATPLRAPDGPVRGYQCVLRPSVPEKIAEPPAETVALALAPPVPPASPTVQVATPVAKGSLVLLVTDDSNMQLDAEQALQRAGIQTVAATEAAAAIREIQARGEQIGALVVEVAAGRGMGYEVLREVLQMPSRVPIVVVGDEIELSTAQRLTLNQPVEFLPGPAHPLALVQRVRAVLEAGRMDG